MAKLECAYPTPGIIRSTSAVDVIIQAMSPDCGHQRQYGELQRQRKELGFWRTHLVEDIEILSDGVTTGGDGAIVRNGRGVVELAQVNRRGIAWGRHRHGFRGSTEARRSGGMGELVRSGFAAMVAVAVALPVPCPVERNGEANDCRNGLCR